MLTSIGRAATRRLVSVAANSSLAATSSRRILLPSKATTLHPLQQLTTAGIHFTAVRGYAAAKTATATKKKTTTAKKAAPKKTATKSKAKAKTTTKAKSKSKATTKKADPAPRGRKKKPLNEADKAKLERKTLKQIASYTEPKSLPEQPWIVFLTEKITGQSVSPTEARTRFADLGAQYRSLPSTEMRRLEEIAQKNKITAAAQYKAWVQTFTPVEVNEANNARQTLKRKYNIPKNSLKLIDDDRQPKRPRTAYALFTKARWASGDLGNKVTDAAKAIGREWRSLPDNEKQPYFDQAKTDLARYEKDVKAIFGRSVRAPKTPAA